MRVTFAVVLAVVVVWILFISLDYSDAARGRGGSRSGGSRSGSRSSKSKSRSKSSSGSKSVSKPKITKYTPIKATSVRSPVIVKQTKLGSRSNTFTKAVVGYLAFRYVLLSTAPVYRSGYPMHRRYVSIPKKRAVRITYEEKKLLDAGGALCVGKSNTTRTLREGIDEQLVELNTQVKYKNGKIQTYDGIDNTISLEDIKDEEFKVTSRARYNTTIVNGTNCTQIETKIEGTMITMYETNPNTASHLYINSKLLASVFVLFAVIPVFVY